jgi:hypothetical protein
MRSSRIAATVAVVILCLLIIFQVLLAAGVPLGRAAWGGEHSVLPANLRAGSLLAAIILGFAVYIVLARADAVGPGAKSRLVRIAIWVFTGYFSLNIVMNLLSSSTLERLVMTPVAAALVVCLFLVARGGAS